jgi:hypothetical protein
MKRFCQFILCAMLAACGSNKQEAEADDMGIRDVKTRKENNLSMVAEARTMIKDGDLILRTGTDYSSEQVKLFSKDDKTYSHGGIAFHDSGDIYVYHVVPDYYHITDKVRKEKLDSFCNPAQNLGFGIARYKMDSAETGTFRRYLDKQFRAKIPFDIRFQLNTDDSMYCSEMIKKGLILATNGRITLANDRLTDRSKYKMISQYFKVPEKVFANREYVPIDQLFLHQNCEFIKRFTYEQ